MTSPTSNNVAPFGQKRYFLKTILSLYFTVTHLLIECLRRSFSIVKLISDWAFYFNIGFLENKIYIMSTLGYMRLVKTIGLTIKRCNFEIKWHVNRINMVRNGVMLIFKSCKLSKSLIQVHFVVFDICPFPCFK